MTTEDRIRQIIAEHLGLSIERLDDQAIIGDDLGADHLDAIELIMAFEDEWNISIPDDKVTIEATVSDIIETVADLVGLRTA